MALWWTDIQQWFDEEDRAIAAGYDSITVFTGDEGSGKSYTMLAINWVKSKGLFSIERVHFDEEAGMADCITLPVGSCVQFDEIDGHRRLAMTRKRMRMLKFLKERRSLRLRYTVGYPHVTQMDRDILNSRVRYWAHVAERVLRVGDTPGYVILLVHRRRSKVINRQGEEPKVVVGFPLVGRFRIEEPSGPLLKKYDAKKWDYTHRDDDIIEALAPTSRIDLEAVRPVIEEIRAAIAAPVPALPPNAVFIDQVLADLKREP
jgi:hypothetical protein